MSNVLIYKQTAIDARRYTFGNDEFSLEAAYHDCKLVFDGITDDDSFQEADTGLVLYYANEIIYALHEALQGKDTNIPSNDSISRQAAIDAKQEFRNPNVVRSTEARTAYDRAYANGWNDCNSAWIDVVKDLPPAQPEIVRCKDCKFTDGERPIADGRYWCVLHSSFMYFCSDAERREE